MITIFDLDGCLADPSHRLHYIVDKKPKDWKSFFSASEVEADKPITPIIALMKRIAEPWEHSVWIVTGRIEGCRDATMRWLNRYCRLNSGAPCWDEIRFRKDGDFRNDDIVKEEVLLEIGPRNVLFAVEDRKRIVDMYRRHGVMTLQTAEGNF